MHHLQLYDFFFFNDTATTEIYTLSLHDALPISSAVEAMAGVGLPTSRFAVVSPWLGRLSVPTADRKSTRLNSSHSQISYAVFCLKKKKTVCILFARPETNRAATTVLHSRPRSYQ